MSKRFIEINKWEDPWFRRLTPKHKCLWQYLCDKCDNAGFWKIDFEIASLFIGEKVTQEDIDPLNKDKTRLKVTDEHIMIVEFIAFQIGDIKSNKLSNLQKNCLFLLQKYKQRYPNLTLTLPQPLGYKYKGKGKGKGIVIVSSNKGVVGGEGIIADLNMVLGTNYKWTSAKTKELVQARLHEGFTVDHFKTVHRKMAKAWGLDNKMRQYLRPITLYSNKFESYLNRKEDIRNFTSVQQNNVKGLLKLNEELKNKSLSNELVD